MSSVDCQQPDERCPPGLFPGLGGRKQMGKGEEKPIIPKPSPIITMINKSKGRIMYIKINIINYLRINFA
jgi:hypothetical protein